MTCSDYQQRILLLRSGELAAEDRSALDAHLARCEACRSFRADQDRVLAQAAAALPSGTPSAGVLARIRAAAAAGSRPIAMVEPVRHAARFRRMALAWAAGLALLLAGLLLLGRHAASPMPPGMQAGIPTPPPATRHVTPPAPPEPALELAAHAEALADTELFRPLLQDECFAVERVSELVQLEQVSRLDMEIMILEGLAI